MTGVVGFLCPTGRREERREGQGQKREAELRKREEGTSQKLEGESERGGSHHEEVRGCSS